MWLWAAGLPGAPVTKPEKPQGAALPTWALCFSYMKAVSDQDRHPRKPRGREAEDQVAENCHGQL